MHAKCFVRSTPGIVSVKKVNLCALSRLDTTPIGVNISNLWDLIYFPPFFFLLIPVTVMSNDKHTWGQCYKKLLSVNNEFL
jgi:hypothetical protein